MIFDEMSYIRSRLCDEESKKIFDARLQLAVDSDYSAFFHNIKENKCFCQSGELETCETFEDFFKKNKNKKIIIYGAGYVGRMNQDILEACGYTVFAYGDSNNRILGAEIHGVPVLSDTEIAKVKNEAVFIVSGREASAIGIYRKLLYLMHINLEQIYVPRFGVLLAVCGRQYFDFFAPVPGEVFVDAGAYNGQTSVEFTKWCPDYKNIYLFEPDSKEKVVIEETMKNAGITKYHLFMKGVSDHSKSSGFCEDHANMSGGHISADGSGKVTVPLISLDEVINDKVTFIKMDIEGEERNALLGAEKLIKTYKPRLAVCVYHKADDFFKIPELILKINNEYKMAMRHYSSSDNETVLYAW